MESGSVSSFVEVTEDGKITTTTTTNEYKRQELLTDAEAIRRQDWASHQTLILHVMLRMLLEMRRPQGHHSFPSRVLHAPGVRYSKRGTIEKPIDRFRKEDYVIRMWTLIKLGAGVVDLDEAVDEAKRSSRRYNHQWRSRLACGALILIDNQPLILVR